MTAVAPPAPARRLCIGVTGHRAAHTALSERVDAVEVALGEIFALLAGSVATAPPLPSCPPAAPVRLHCLLADGVDQIAARLAISRGWELSCPLPFGRTLNAAINAAPQSLDDVRALLAGDDPVDPLTGERATAIHRLGDSARLFELSECDAAIEALLIAHWAAPDDAEAARLFAAEGARRVALAGSIMIEQSDLVVAVWDGTTTAHVGGTGHTMAAALDAGAPVVWIDPAEPAAWRILRTPEAMATHQDLATGQADELKTIVRAVLDPDGDAHRHPPGDHGVATLTEERWRGRSNRWAHGYRRVEALFGKDQGQSRFRRIVQHYELPEAVAEGTGKPLLAEAAALPHGDPAAPAAIEASVLRRFAWADGVSARLSDAYRGGMMINFVLSSLAVVGGIAYLPLYGPERKWPFAAVELLLIAAILAITLIGQKRRWHRRWLETRRVAEYLRHAPLLILLGVARPPGRWPRGTTGSWPEWYARQAIREVGLPQATITAGYLRRALEGPLAEHVVAQRDYHIAKAQRLKHVHHGLDRLALFFFILAVISVAAYLMLKGATATGSLAPGILDGLSKWFTLAGVIFPSFASAIAGIRFFGDFERFAAISEVTAEKLDAIARRIAALGTAPDSAIDYGRVAEIAHATDATVVAEIESWQSVFGGKQIALPA